MDSAKLILIEWVKKRRMVEKEEGRWGWIIYADSALSRATKLPGVCGHMIGLSDDQIIRFDLLYSTY